MAYLIVCFFWINGFRAQNINSQLLGILTGGLALLTIWMLIRIGYKLVSLPVVFLAYAWLYHFSLGFLCSLNPNLWSQAPEVFRDWAEEGPWNASLVYSVLCFAMLAAGCIISGAPKKKSKRANVADECDLVLFKAGIALAIIMAGVILGIIFKAGGLSVISRGYLTNFQEGVFGRAFFSSVQFFAFGISFAVAGAPRKYLWIPITVQLLTTLVLLSLGTRGPALVSIIVLLLLLYKRGIRLRLLPAIVLIIGVFWVISFVKQGRDAGMLAGATNKAQVNAIGGVLELGGTLRSVSIMVGWTDDDPSAFQLGKTYWLPFERAIGLFVPGLRIELKDDLRSFGNAVNSREAFLGGTIIGESYYNFGVFGGLLFLPLGMFLCKIDKAARSPFTLAVMAVLSYVLIYYVRDYFLPVPPGIIFGLVIILVVNAWSKRKAAEMAYASSDCCADHMEDIH